MKPDNRTNVQASKVHCSLDLKGSPARFPFVQLIVMKPDSRTNVEADKVHCNNINVHRGIRANQLSTYTLGSEITNCEVLTQVGRAEEQARPHLRAHRKLQHTGI